MPYLGNISANRFASTPATKRFNGDGSTTSFTLDTAASADQEILVSVDGVIQDSANYTVTGTTLDFGTGNAPSTGTGNIFVNYIARPIATVGHPSTSNLQAAAGTFTSTLDVTGNTTLSGNLTLTGTPTGNFITHIDQYRIIRNFDTDNNPLGSGTPSNNTIERNDTTGAALLGTAMTNSSGIFSFPTTGLWRVETSVYYKADASTNDGGLKTDIQLTTDNSNFNTMARGSGNSHNTSLAAEDSVYVQVYLDITNTSTHKVKFTSDSTGNANTTIQGDTDISKTWFCFTRFGDT